MADALEEEVVEGGSDAELQEALVGEGGGVCSRVSGGVCAGVEGPDGAALGGPTVGVSPRGRM